MKKKDVSDESFYHPLVGKPYQAVINATATPRHLTWIFSLIFVLFIAVILFTPYTTKVKVPGVLVPDKGLIRMYAESDAVIVKVHAGVGDQVKKGDLIYTLELKNSDLLSDEAFKLKSDIFNDQLAALHTQKIAKKKYIDIKIKEAKLELNKYIGTKNGKTDKNKIDEKLKLDNIKYKSLQNALHQLELEKTIDLAELDFQSSLINLEITKIKPSKQYQLTSPINGTVTDIQGHIGASVSSKVAIATIIPEKSELRCQLYISSDGIGFIKEGLPIEIAYSAFPKKSYGTFSAKIVEISNSVFKENEVDSIVSLPKGNYFLSVGSLDAQELIINDKMIKLRPGMELTATIIARKQTLYEWISTPINNILNYFHE